MGFLTHLFYPEFLSSACHHPHTLYHLKNEGLHKWDFILKNWTSLFHLSITLLTVFVIQTHCFLGSYRSDDTPTIFFNFHKGIFHIVMPLMDYLQEFVVNVQF